MRGLARKENVMACSKLKFLLATSVFAMAAAGFVGQAAGNVDGTNAFLDKKHGKIYIPSKPQSGPVQGGEVSDALGTKVGPGKYVGAASDTVKIAGLGASTGEVSVTLNFLTGGSVETGDGVAQEVSAMDPATAALFLTFNDMDFKPTDTRGYTYSETLELYFLRDVGDEPSQTPDLVLDASNYLNFRSDGGIATNKTKATYTLGMAAHLGVSSADFDAINESGHFAILAKFTTHLTNNSKKTQSFRNSPESFGAVQSDVIGVPEPTSLAVIAIGSLVTLIRRKR